MMDTNNGIVSGEILCDDEEKTVIEDTTPQLPTEVPITYLRKMLLEKGSKVWTPVVIGQAARWVPVTKSYLKNALKGFPQNTQLPGTYMLNQDTGEVHIFLYQG